MQRRAWNSEEIRELACRYPVEGAGSVAAKLGRSIDSVVSLARRLGVPAESRRVRQAISRATNSPTVNAHFFDQLTPEVAYVLGFLAGGGVKTKHRRVLRIAVDASRVNHLSKVLDLLQSQHQVQQYGSRLVVEVGNSYLVNRLLTKFNWPPGKHSPDPPMPDVPADLVPHFARGHLDRSGWQDDRVIRWTGSPKQTRQLADEIQMAAGVSVPRYIQYGALLNVAWIHTLEVNILNNWLAGSRISGTYPIAVTLERDTVGKHD